MEIFDGNLSLVTMEADGCVAFEAKAAIVHHNCH